MTALLRNPLQFVYQAKKLVEDTINLGLHMYLYSSNTSTS